MTAAAVLEQMDRPAPPAHYPRCGPECGRPLTPVEARLKAAAAARKSKPKGRRK